MTRRSAAGEVTWRADRPALLLSSTSWTPDEDFAVLLEAICELDEAIGRDRLPNVVVCVTGKGPQKAEYVRKIRGMSLRHVAVRTLWLEARDYPLLVGAADVGVCLHTSTSGLDLPMKVVDMFGSGLPVCAVGFEALTELVQHDTNGLVFDDAKQLAAQLLQLLHGWTPGGDRGSGSDTLRRLRRGVQETRSGGWAENWTQNAQPLLLGEESA